MKQQPSEGGGEQGQAPPIPHRRPAPRPRRAPPRRRPPTHLIFRSRSLFSLSRRFSVRMNWLKKCSWSFLFWTSRNLWSRPCLSANSLNVVLENGASLRGAGLPPAPAAGGSAGGAGRWGGEGRVPGWRGRLRPPTPAPPSLCGAPPPGASGVLAPGTETCPLSLSNRTLQVSPAPGLFCLLPLRAPTARLPRRCSGCRGPLPPLALTSHLPASGPREPSLCPGEVCRLRVHILPVGGEH